MGVIHYLPAFCLVLLVWGARAEEATAGNQSSAANTSISCPPPGFDSVPKFNLTQYAAAPWFVQKQVPVSYQQPNQLYCVRAHYQIINPDNLTEGTIVHNYANQDRVNGPAMGTSDDRSNFTVLAVPDTSASGPSASSKLLVGPAQFKALFPNAPGSGPYWVVAVGPSENSTIGFDWAIVTGGSPTMRTPNGKCLPGSSQTKSTASPSSSLQTGFWLFSRKPVDPAATAVMEAKAQELGLDTSQLLTVQQEGCTYEKAT